MVLLALVAVLAGGLTTISGFGGGILLLLACTALLGAKPALAVTSIVLLAGNIHRVWLYRADVRAPVTVPLLVGLVPGSLLGGLTAAAIPERAVHGIMIAVVGASLLHAWRGWSWRPGPRALFGAALVVG